ncbi:golgin subfamily A member 7-like [Petromyzon marinus]|uniref:Ras modification protein ERF4 n=1 Tax=Petromyzon marinus TaxID=7757 RepID=A0AAJ7UGB7_PETMA|nr:golgin subfamily A member 7-like [Petromyzon marinus]XP_032835934.1 golgin subfamily A member 7-like [Petromyzon marinus]
MAEVDSLTRAVPPGRLVAKAFVHRDYSLGTACRYHVHFPSELTGKVEAQQFEETLRGLNALFEEAERLDSHTYLESCLACLTAYLVYTCVETHYQKVLKRVSRFVCEQNEAVYVPRGLHITDPMERGLRVVEVSVYEDH